MSPPKKMSISVSVETALSCIAIPVLVLLVYPGILGAVFPLQWSLDAILTILAAYGIQSLYMLRKLYLSVTLPTFISDKMLVGFDAIASLTWLMINHAIALDQYAALVAMILSALGLLGLGLRKLSQ